MAKSKPKQNKTKAPMQVLDKDNNGIDMRDILGAIASVLVCMVALVFGGKFGLIDAMTWDTAIASALIVGVGVIIARFANNKTLKLVGIAGTALTIVVAALVLTILSGFGIFGLAIEFFPALLVVILVGLGDIVAEFLKPVVGLEN